MCQRWADIAVWAEASAESRSLLIRRVNKRRGVETVSSHLVDWKKVRARIQTTRGPAPVRAAASSASIFSRSTQYDLVDDPRDKPAISKHLHNIYTTSAQSLRRCIHVIQMLCLLDSAAKKPGAICLPGGHCGNNAPIYDARHWTLRKWEIWHRNSERLWCDGYWWYVTSGDLGVRELKKIWRDCRSHWLRVQSLTEVIMK